MTGGEASCGIRMEHTRLGKPLSGECKSASPRGLALLATTPECLPPKAQHPVPKDSEAIEISRHCVVVEVALHHRPEPFAGLGTGSCMRWRSCCLISCSFFLIRLRIVVRRTV